MNTKDNPKVAIDKDYQHDPFIVDWSYGNPKCKK